MFLPLKLFCGAASEILDQHYKIQPSSDHRAKFRADRPTQLEVWGERRELPKRVAGQSPGEKDEFGAF